MRRLELFEDWHGWQRVEMMLGAALVVLGVLVIIFPKLLAILFAVLCIGIGATLIHTAFRERRASRAFGETKTFRAFAEW